MRVLRLAYLTPLAALMSVASACSSTSAVKDDLIAETGVETGDLDTGPALDTGLVIDTGSGGGFATYRITPSNSIIKIDLSTGTPGSVALKMLKTQDGAETDVTDVTEFKLADVTLGAFSKNTFTSVTKLPEGVMGRTSRVSGVPGNGVANLTVIALRTSGDSRDFFFSVPYMKDPDPNKDILKFGTKIQQVDVAFLLDKTASMGPEIKNLRESLNDDKEGIVVQLSRAIPSVGVAYATFEDFPVAPFGYPGGTLGRANIPFDLRSAVTTSLSKVRSAIADTTPYAGGATPEAAYEAQYELLTGEGLTWTADKAGSIAARTPKAGTAGGADFRPGSLPILVNITDAGWFEASTYNSLSAGKLVPHSKDDVVAAYKSLKAKFVGIHAVIEKTGGGIDVPCEDYKNASCDSASGYKKAVAMAEATESSLDPAAFTGCPAGKCCTGFAAAPMEPNADGKCPLVFQVKTDGTGVSSGIVSAIQAISLGASFDVTAIPSNDPSNAAGEDGSPVDATKFIKNLRAIKEGVPTVGCKAREAKDTNGDGVDDTFVAVTVGEPVCFEVIPKMNDFVPPKPAAQFFNAFVDVVGLPGSIKLDRRTVLFLVPPSDPGPAK